MKNIIKVNAAILKKDGIDYTLCFHSMYKPSGITD
jgi:hypothetical protein